MATKTTRKLFFDPGKVIPGLAEHEYPCIRLHPRPASLPVNASKIGGMILWPSAERWPFCSQPSFSEKFMRSYGGPPMDAFTAIHNCHFEALLQLRKSDFPDLGYPSDTDLMQVLWCPHQHLDIEGDAEPAYRVYWRKESELGELLREAPAIPDFPGRQPVRECALHQEFYPDYPEVNDLDLELEDWTPPKFPPEWKRVEREEAEPALPDDSVFDKAREFLGSMFRGMGKSEAEIEREMQGIGKEVLPPRFLTPGGREFYSEYVGPVPGTKLFGYPGWVQGPDWPKCKRGHDMSFLLQFDSSELGHVDAFRWCPMEDLEAYDKRPREESVWDSEIGSGPHLMFGDAGRLMVFVCTECKDRPAAFVHQCG